MDDTKRILARFLAANGAQRYATAGPGKARSREALPKTAAADPNHMISDLRRRTRQADWIIVVCVLFLAAILGVGLWLAVVMRGSPAALTAVLGGSLLSLLTAVDRLRRIWFERLLSDLLIHAAETLDQEQLVELVAAFYFGRLRGKLAELSIEPRPGAAGGDPAPIAV